MITKELLTLHLHLKQAFDNQQLFLEIQNQIDNLESCKREINEKYMKINSDLTLAVGMAKIEVNNSVSGFLK